MLGNLTVKTAAKLMDKTEMFVRIGLRRQSLPFGVAVQGQKGGRWSYHISPGKFAEYMGISMEALNKACEGMAHGR